MTNKRGQLIREISNQVHKYGSSILRKSIDEYCKYIKGLSTRTQVGWLVDNYNERGKELMKKRLSEQEEIAKLATEIVSKGARDKLICSVYNELSEEFKGIVMEGPEVQLQYLADRYGVECTKVLVKRLTK